MTREYGETRNDLARDHKKLLEKAMNIHNKTHDVNYFILMISGWKDGKFGDKRMFTQAYVLPYRLPVDMIGSILYEVDPKNGTHEIVYCKPRDTPILLPQQIGRSSTLDKIAQSCADSNTPIVH